MGNCSSLHGQRNQHNVQSLIGTADGTHEGIKTVHVEKACEFSTGSVLCVCVVTWNMNGKFSPEDLRELVGRDRKFDILAIGLQEAPKHNIAELLQESLAETHRCLVNCYPEANEMMWLKFNHILLGEATMQSLKLFLFGAKSSQTYIKELRVDKQAIGGCGGLIGRKKGAVAIYINFSGIRMVFISCHLSAHEHKVEERNSECKHISHSLFSKDDNSHSRPSHVSVWLGDLNYRLQDISTQPARSLIRKNLQSILVEKDQLLQEAERGEVFNGYCEGTLSFKPTYKYNVGSSSYDTSYKIRVPSWTDRILFKVENNSGIDAVLHSYESIDHIKSSDHKPVKAHLCLKVNRV